MGGLIKGLLAQIQSWFGIYNVVHYGADPTGANDSTTAIQNAINAADGSGMIKVPPGTYSVTGITLKSGTKIVGSGRHNTKIILANTTNVDVLTTVNDAQNIESSDITVDGNSANNTSGEGISFPYNASGASHCHIYRATIQNIAKIGIDFGTVSTECTITDCTISSTGADAIYMGEPLDATISRVKIYDANTGNNANVGAITLLYHWTNMRIENVEIDNSGTGSSTGFGIFANATQTANNLVITGCIMQNFGSHGIMVYANNAAVTNVNIGNCIVSNAGKTDGSGTGVYVVQAGTGTVNKINISNVLSDTSAGYGIEVVGNQFTITGCTVINGGDPGIHAQGSSFTISGNYSNNPGGGFGITLNACSKGTVTGNVCEGNGYGGIGVYGASGDHLNITGNACMNNGVLAGGSTWEYAGIAINPTAPATYLVVQGNQCTDTQTTKTQTYGINEANGNYNFIANNDVRGNATTNLNITGANTTNQGNLIA